MLEWPQCAEHFPVQCLLKPGSGEVWPNCCCAGSFYECSKHKVIPCVGDSPRLQPCRSYTAEGGSSGEDFRVCGWWYDPFATTASIPQDPVSAERLCNTVLLHRTSAAPSVCASRFLRRAECWRHVLRANQISKQQNQLLQAPPPAPVACHAPHSPPGPTKISPNVSNLSASTPLSRTPHKRCRSDDEDDPARSRPKGARTESPRTAQATPASQRWEQTRGIDAARRPEHEMHRHKASRRSPARRSSVKSPKTAVPDPPSPESLEEGELR